MKAVRYHGFGGPARVEEVEVPFFAPHEVLIRVAACQIGGDVLKVLAGTGPVRNAAEFQFPHTPGYRGAGQVEAVGAAVTRLRVGERVAINGFVNCGRCAYCRRGLDNLCQESAMLGIDSGTAGAMAEFVSAPEWALAPVPEAMSLIEATLLPNVALLVHAFERVTTPEEFTVAVFGCGYVGSAAVGVAKAYGASRIVAIDSDPAALSFAERCGATETVEARDEGAAVEAIGDGVDVAVEVVGLSETVERAVASTAARGTTLLIGALNGISLSLPEYYRDVIQREIEIKPCFGKTQEDFARAVDLAASGLLDLSPYSFREYPLAQFHDALSVAAEASASELHVIRPTKGSA